MTVRFDTDVLEWLRAFGKGYQTRMDRILRAAMESQRNQKALRFSVNARWAEMGPI